MTRLYLATLAFVVLTANVYGHGVPTVISLNAEKTGLVAPPRAGVVVLVGGDTVSNEPGLGFGPEAAAPPIDTRLGLETTGGLVYWDGAEIVDTDATLAIDAPDFDHFGVPNASAVRDYLVDADTGVMTGMTWSAYGGGDFWHANGFFTLGGPPAEPLPGVYGVPIRLVTMPGGAQLEPTAPFLLPVFYDPAGTWTGAEALEGIEALEATLAEPADFNADGFVDIDDYALWATNYAAVDPTTGDVNGDGLVNAADYTLWRDAMTSPAAPAIPEPHALVIVTIATLSLSFDSQRKRKIL